MLSSDWIDKLGTYLSCMNHEQGIRTSYQSLLTTLEVFILGLIFTLYQLNLTLHLWLLPVGGIILGFFFGVPCEFRARNVDFWRNEIVKLVKDTDLEETFNGGKYRWIPLGKVGFWAEYLFGHWFERILVSTILLVWFFVLLFFNSAITILVLGELATIFWIIYAFKIIEFKGKTMLKE